MIRRNLTLFKWDNFLGGLWPLSTLSIVYFSEITQSYALAMAVFSISSLVTTFMEIPVGIFSDKMGRRKTLLCSPILVFLTFLCWALAGQFSCAWLLFVGAICWGTSGAIASGTVDALVYETMEELKQKDNFNIQYAQNGGWNQIGLALSAVSAAVITYFFSLQVLAWVSVLPVLLQIFVVYMFIEPNRLNKTKKVCSFKHFLIAFRQLWRNKRLKFYAIIHLLDNAFGMASFRFESAYYQMLIPDWLINMARFLKQICGIISFFIVPYIRKIGMVRLYFLSLILNVFVRIWGIVLNNVFTPFIMSTVNLFYGTACTANADIMQQEFSTQQRATMHSIISFLSGILLAMTMILFGYIADIYNPRMAIIIAIVLKLVLCVVSLILLRKMLVKR
ncbi:MAG: MFS transporter [Alphaproteobacteria bacterium]|nr:MFS transporter [Alphaproteobacteria bacterium]